MNKELKAVLENSAMVEALELLKAEFSAPISPLQLDLDTEAGLINARRIQAEYRGALRLLERLKELAEGDDNG